MAPEPALTPRRAETRRKLLDAAMDVFAERGFHAASVDDVARAAGYSIGALYSNFGGKDELFLAIFDEHLAWAERTFGETPADAGTAGWAKVAQDWPRQFHIFVEFWAYAVRDPDLREQLAARLRELRTTVANAITRVARAHGREPALPAEELGVVAIALMRGLAFDRIADPDAVPDDLIAWLVDRLSA